MTSSVILTVVGSDRPGLTQALADAVLAAGGNWLESHLARLGGKYVGSVLVELPEDRLADLEAHTKAIDATGLRVALVGADTAAAEAGVPLALELVGQDRPGIVREVTTVLAGLRVNIDEFETRRETGSWSGEQLFRATAALRLPDDLSQDAVQEALERISGEIMVDFSVSPAT
ncbi:MAG: ACT domain-containing protein [Sphingomonadaceae bacterium]|nr:ACT domain-containing protein [Sphingomonadaceae bacterium]